MSAAIVFYFDFSSPYAYFASTRIDALAARYGRTVRWQPILLPAIFQVTGGSPAPSVPIKGSYVMRDFERTAHEQGIAYRKPDQFPVLSIAPARAMQWIAASAGEAAAVTFAKRCFKAYFSEGIDMCDPAQLAVLAGEQGIAGDALLAGMQSPAIKDGFKQANEQAIANGVFGAPFIIVDGEPFWGFDRFHQLEACLCRKAEGEAGFVWAKAG